jgi:uncharacterized GH25 family protein
MKRFGQTVLFILVGIFFLYQPTAMAHDGWAEPTPSLVERGQFATIALIQGNHSNEHKSFRIAGKWNPQYTKLLVIDPTGKPTDLSGRLVDMGEDEEKIGPKGPKGFYIASFLTGKEGIYRVLARQERVLQHGEGPKFRSVRTATSALAALSVPTVSSAKKLRWLDGQVGQEDALEIVPSKNLLGIRQGEAAVLQVRYKGKPARDQVVSVLRRINGPQSVQDFVTNPEGLINFVVGPEDYYLVRVKLDEEGERAQGQYEKSSYEATYVFQVFNRR